MSMMCPPQRVKITSIPSARRALATRWPPEIVSGSVSRAAGASACAAVLVAVTWSLLPRASTSVQTSGGPLHVVGEIERVLTHEPLGQIGVAGLERLDDVHVVDDRALGAVVLPNHAAANRPHVHQQAGDQVGDHGRATELDDALMEAQVRVRVLVQVQAQLVVVDERREQLAQAADLLVRRPHAYQAGGHALERRPGSYELGDLALALAHDEYAPARHDLHQSLV